MIIMPNSTLTSTPKVVIVGLDHSIGLQTARIFAQRNVSVIGIARVPTHYCCRTNVCEKILFADTYHESLIESLVSLGKSLDQKAVLIPCRDPSVYVISRLRKELEPYYHFLLPEHEVVETLIDKEGFSKLASKEGFQIPKTHVIQNSEKAKKSAAELKYPCVIKPGLKTDEWEKATNKKVFKVFCREELVETYEKFKQFSETLIVQEWVEGTDLNLYSCNCYFDRNSEPVVTFVARKIRQWPPHIGQTSLGEECRDDVVMNESIRFFKKVGFMGIGYLEFKKDENSGEYYFIEPNIGRPTGRSALAEACGVELLYSMYCDLTGQQLPSERQQKYLGVKWINLATDSLSAFQLWRNGELSLLEWLRSVRGKKYFAIWSLADPMPFVWQFAWGVRHHSKIQNAEQKRGGQSVDSMIRHS
jgi:predicted ATP-grasp superfamily ATP-dependent carboligase